MLKSSLSQSVERLSEDTFAAQVSELVDYMLTNSMEFPSSSDSGTPQGTSPSVSGIGEVFKGLSG